MKGLRYVQDAQPGGFYQDRARGLRRFQEPGQIYKGRKKEYPARLRISARHKLLPNGKL